MRKYKNFRRVLTAVSVCACVYSLPEMFVVIVSKCAKLDATRTQIAHYEPMLTQRLALLTSPTYSIVYKLVSPLLVLLSILKLRIIWCNVPLSRFLYSLLPYVILLTLTVRISLAISTASKQRKSLSIGPSRNISTACLNNGGSPPQTAAAALAHELNRQQSVNSRLFI